MELKNKNMNIQSLIGALTSKGYAVFQDDSRNYNINIVGVRKTNPVINTFDDSMYVFWKYSGQWYLETYNITTVPGLFYLDTPDNPKGTAILVPNQYRGTFQLGLHKGEYQCLVQYKNVEVYRDNKRNGALSSDPSTI